MSLTVSFAIVLPASESALNAISANVDATRNRIQNFLFTAVRCVDSPLVFIVSSRARFILSRNAFLSARFCVKRQLQLSTGMTRISDQGFTSRYRPFANKRSFAWGEHPLGFGERYVKELRRGERDRDSFAKGQRGRDLAMPGQTTLGWREAMRCHAAVFHAKTGTEESMRAKNERATVRKHDANQRRVYAPDGK